MTFLPESLQEPTRLASAGGVHEQVHVFEPETLLAINAALAAGRPLLVRGEPGVGKSQLARAAAKELGRVFLPHVVDVRTESRDLLWSFDAVERLAEAQLSAALREDPAQTRARLKVLNFVRPGILWWAFNWTDAADQAKTVGAAAPPQWDGGRAENGAVVLVDEIDKAETDVPNGLLEALGAGAFTPQGRDQPVTASERPPLVVITTNEERALPDAFLRRCLVLYLNLPDQDDALVDRLVARGLAHFPHADPHIVHKTAGQLAEDRRKAREADRLPLPGQAEFLDLLRALLKLAPGDPDRQERVLKQIAQYTLRKHAGVA